MTVPMVRLADVARLNPRPTTRLTADTIVSFIAMADVDAISASTSQGHERLYAEVANGYTQFIDRDLLVAKITPCFQNGKIAQARLCHHNGAGSTEFHVIRPDTTRVNDRFLLRFLRQPHVIAAGERRMTGSGGQRRVPEAYLAELRLPGLSLEEQRWVANALDRTDLLRSQRVQVIRTLDELAQSIFVEMFGDVQSNDRQWQSAPLKAVADIASGVTKGRKVNSITRTVLCITVANVQDRRLKLEEVKRIDATEDEIKRHLLVDGDLLLTEGGDPDKLGRGTIWRSEIPECIHQNHIFRVRLYRDAPVDPVFLNWLVASQRGKRYFLRSAKQTTGIASINATQLRNFGLLIPPIELQRQFADRLSVLERFKANHLAHLAELDALFASVQHRAFTGQLFTDGTPDPDSVLPTT